VFRSLVDFFVLQHAVVFLAVSSCLSIISAFVATFVCVFVLIFVFCCRRSVLAFVVVRIRCQRRLRRVDIMAELVYEMFSAVGLRVLHFLLATSCI
jgi:hypothetical protein